MTKTEIEWATDVWNPTAGCDRVSPGCDHCYALTMAKRLKGMGQPKYQLDGDPRTSGPGFGAHAWPDALGWPLTVKKPMRVFVNSMSDLFHDRISDEYIAAVFGVMALAPQHTFQVLTKRHARMRSLLSDPLWWNFVTAHTARKTGTPITYQSPLPNVWLGVSVENQQWADIRIPALLDTPAAVRFLSCEPLLGPVDLSAWMPTGYAKWSCSGCRRLYSGPHQDVCPGCERQGYWTGSHTGNGRPSGQPIGWVIVGGESGHGARPMQPEWAQSLRDQCLSAGVPFLFKQWGEYAQIGQDGPMRRIGKKHAGRELDGRTWDQYPEPAQ